MSAEFYKVIHLFGVLLLLCSLTALAMVPAAGADVARAKAARKPLMAGHGIALFVIFVAGFGLMARMGVMGMPWPAWIWIKIAVWVVLAGIVAVIRRQPESKRMMVIVLPLIAVVAAWSAVFKPGG